MPPVALMLMPARERERVNDKELLTVFIG